METTSVRVAFFNTKVFVQAFILAKYKDRRLDFFLKKNPYQIKFPCTPATSNLELREPRMTAALSRAWKWSNRLWPTPPTPKYFPNILYSNWLRGRHRNRVMERERYQIPAEQKNPRWAEVAIKEIRKTNSKHLPMRNRGRENKVRESKKHRIEKSEF